jgi:hypothetical protein
MRRTDLDDDTLSFTDPDVDVEEFFDDSDGAALGCAGYFLTLLRHSCACIVGDTRVLSTAEEVISLTTLSPKRRSRSRCQKSFRRKRRSTSFDADILVEEISCDSEEWEDSDEEEDALERRAAGPAVAVAAATPIGPMKAIVNFSGHWTLDHSASDNPSAQLTALGVPWLARKAIANASRSLVIEQRGWKWKEIVTTSIITKEMDFTIDGANREEVSPIDQSVVKMCTVVEESGMCVVTRNVYTKLGHRAEIRRRLMNGGKTYHVKNTLTLKTGKAICVNNYFSAA